MDYGKQRTVVAFINKKQIIELSLLNKSKLISEEAARALPVKDTCIARACLAFMISDNSHQIPILFFLNFIIRIISNLGNHLVEHTFEDAIFHY